MNHIPPIFESQSQNEGIAIIFGIFIFMACAAIVLAFTDKSDNDHFIK